MPGDDIWQTWGVLPEGRERCEQAMRLMLEAVELAGPDLAGVVFAEAKFQLYDLPHRTPEYQRARRWEPR